MKRFEIIKRRSWHNPTTGQRVSAYGAHPGEGFVITYGPGYTFIDHRSGTVGSPAITPTSTYQDVVTVLERWQGKDWGSQEI